MKALTQIRMAKYFYIHGGVNGAGGLEFPSARKRPS